MRAEISREGGTLSCVTFVWPASEAPLDKEIIHSRQDAADTVIQTCETEQPDRPVDLSIFADCLRDGALTRGHAPRGIVVISPELSRPSFGEGHKFVLRRRFDVRLEFPLITVVDPVRIYWLPGCSNMP